MEYSFAGNEYINYILDTYSNMLIRLAFTYLKNTADAEDIVQEVFVALIKRVEGFDNDEHEKAWLIRVTVNACRDLLKSAFRNKVVSLDDLVDLPAAQRAEHGAVLEAVLHLPTKYRDVVYLHYYEGYSAAEIGKILRKNVNTVYTLLARARGQLKLTLGGDGYGN